MATQTKVVNDNGESCINHQPIAARESRSIN